MQNAEANGRGKGAKSGVGRLERMKHGNGIKDRDHKSSGIEILMHDGSEMIRFRGSGSCCVIYCHSKFLWSKLLGYTI